MATDTGAERYRKHEVWGTLTLKLDALKTIRFGNANTEQKRVDVIEWLAEALKTKATQQPSLYLSTLDDLDSELNLLPSTENEFKRYIDRRSNGSQGSSLTKLEAALRSLPLPAPKVISDKYGELLDQQIETGTTRLNELRGQISDAKKTLEEAQATVAQVNDEVDALRSQAKAESTKVSNVLESAEKKIGTDWESVLGDWKRKRDDADTEHNRQALGHLGSLAATSKAGKSLAKYAAGDLTATEWAKRATRERRSAKLLRYGAVVLFIGAAVVAIVVLGEAIRNAFDLTIGDGILRSSITLVLGAFGALILRESGRHFREADAAEDVSLSLQSLALFYEDSDEKTKNAARNQVGDAVLVKNVLSRFAHRDAAKHAGDVNTAKLTELVESSMEALRISTPDETSQSELRGSTTPKK